MAKICILSMQEIQNYGSLLQAYSLKKMLEQLGHEVSFIDIEKRDEDNILRGSTHHSYENVTNGIFEQLKKINRNIFIRFRVRNSAQKQNKLFEYFRRESLGIFESDNKRHYDYCVIGSDEVFNCLANTAWGFTSQLFGNVHQASHVITYAASCGATELSQVPIPVVEKIKNAFERISAFSVRDKNTEFFVEELSGEKCEIHLDPVVVGNFEKEITDTEMPSGLSGNYCVVYSYRNRISSEEEIDGIKKFCRSHGMKIVSVGAPQFWIPDHIVCDPFQMLKVFSNAGYIITDTFHGTIFSTKYAKHFAVIVRESNQNKLLDLIGRLGIREHKIEGISQLEKAFYQKNDLDRVSKLTYMENCRAIRYLKQNIV